MAWFKCLIRGENFPGTLIDRPGLVGFYVTRFVEAASLDEAETESLRTLRDEPKLARPSSEVPTGRTKVFFEEITELSFDEVPARQLGIAWHPMDI
jgi:hypothetical protein